MNGYHLSRAVRYLRERRGTLFPALAGFTAPPPSDSRFPGEYEQTRGVLYGWPSYGCAMTELTELIRNSVEQDWLETTVIVPAGQLTNAQNCLLARGFTPDQVAQVNWNLKPLDGVWIRDFGFRANVRGKPEVIFSARGRAVADQLGAGDGHVSLTDEAGFVVAFAVLMKKGA